MMDEKKVTVRRPNPAGSYAVLTTIFGIMTAIFFVIALGTGQTIYWLMVIGNGLLAIMNLLQVSAVEKRVSEQDDLDG